MLNNNQKKAVNYKESKPLLIKAGPGSGKTHVLVERVKFLVNKKVNPESILLITFTVKASKELKARLSVDIPKDKVDLMQISTIHSFCHKLLDENDFLNIIAEDTANLFIRKYKYKLGFKDESFLPNSEIDVVLDKFNEFTTFNVDIPNLVKYLEENYPVSEEYIKFVSEFESFPRDYINDKENENYKNDWYNAKYIQIAKAYPRYLKLLEKNNAVDYALLQSKALIYLKKNPQTKYKNVLIDEFQDTDFTQKEIFKVLLENADSFTAVGDKNQSIYSFRGALPNVFNEFEDSYDLEIINLNENYRSSNEIIEIYNSLRGSKSKPMRNYSNSSYYLNNLNSEKEGEKIFELIKELIDNNKIENLSDIAVLYRSIKLGNSSLNSLITLLKEHDIPYQVQGLEDIMNNNDIKAVMTVLYYLIPSETGAPIRNRWQINWLNIKAFTGANFETSLFNLNSETKDIINDLWDDYEKLALDTFKEVYKAEKKKTSRIRTYNGIFKQNIDIINKTFEKINVPGLDDIIANINDKNDLEFFKGIDSISKKIIKNKEIKLLDIYYEVLNFLDLFNEDNKELFGNLGLISTIVYNYDLMLQNNLSRLFYFLGQILEKTDNKLDDEVDAVQLMTIHKAKGLEFPITIVASLKDEKFPKKHPDPEFKKRFVYGKPTYYIPNKFLEYKDYSQDDEVKFHDDEEERILYVALSRAQDILVLSSVENSNILENLISKNQGNIIPLTKMNKIKSVNKKEKDLINLSYSSYQKYKSCPFKYDLLFNHDFKKSVGGDETIGTIIHKTFEILNKKIKENYYTPTKEEIKKLVSKIKQNFNIEIKENEIEKIVENILYFYEEYGEMEILDAEYSFKIKNNNYVLTGAIDLIFKTGNGEIGIIDYKNTTMKEDYSYQKQLYTYLFALKNDPKYSEYEINSLNIYYIESRNLVQFEINNEDYFNLLKNFHDVARYIEEKKFDKNLDGNYCRRCYFKDLC